MTPSRNVQQQPSQALERVNLNTEDHLLEKVLRAALWLLRLSCMLSLLLFISLLANGSVEKALPLKPEKA